MALKFLNKKGWHTGSLRNIEKVWKAEQKHEAEQKKLEELRKQIQEEKEQAGLTTRSERLEFLYDSGLALGKGSSSTGFKALESFPPKTDTSTSVATTSSSTKQSFLPGALFEEIQQSSNDAWRKLHSDPLFLIRQKEQEALTRIKNNPIQMAMIRKSVEATKNKERMQDEYDEGASRRNHRQNKKHEKQRRSSGSRGSYNKLRSSEDGLSSGDIRDKTENFKYKERGSSTLPESTTKKRVAEHTVKETQDKCLGEETHSEGMMGSISIREKKEGEISQNCKSDSSNVALWNKPLNKRRKPVKLSQEERAARLLEMQMNAKIHEEQRWKRLKKSEENDIKEVVRAGVYKGRNFLDDVQKSVYGTTDKGGSSTIEESIRRRTHYLQGRSEATERNAFRRWNTIVYIVRQHRTN